MMLTPKDIFKKELHLDVFEAAVQLIIVCIAIYSTALATRWWWAQHNPPCDFTIYFYAGYGKFVEGWIYKDWLTPIFSVLHLWDKSTSYMYWAGFQTVCFMVLAHKLMQLKYGWIFILVNLYHFSTYLIDGNIQPLLMLLCCFPVGSIFAIFIKPYHAVISILFFFFNKKNSVIKRLGYWWFLVIAIAVAISIPSQKSVEFAYNQGYLFDRYMIMAISIYYACAKAQKREGKK